MNISPIKDANERVFAFEVENVYIGIQQIVRILKSINGVTDIKTRKLFSDNPDIHIEFRFFDKEFMVWEPYADSSRYWIGPKNDNTEYVDIGNLVEAFRQYEVNIFKKVLGYILSLGTKA